jgi:hypothetical protein
MYMNNTCICRGQDQLGRNFYNMYMNIGLWNVKKGLISGELDLRRQLSQAKCDNKGWEED